MDGGDDVANARARSTSHKTDASTESKPAAHYKAIRSAMAEDVQTAVLAAASQSPQQQP